jgi:hypothetical protein
VPEDASCVAPGALVAGGGHLAFGCSASSTANVLTLPSGPWTATALPPECATLSAGFESGCSVAGVGRFWFRVLAHCYHRAAGSVYERLSDGSMEASPQNGSVAADMNSVQLARELCSPLRVLPQASIFFESGVVVQTALTRLRIQRCGRRRPLVSDGVAGAVAVRPHVVIWRHGLTELEGACLPSGARFVMRAPVGASIAAITLGQHHVYLTGQDNQGTSHTWAAKSPPCGAYISRSGALDRWKGPRVSL